MPRTVATQLRIPPGAVEPVVVAGRGARTVRPTTIAAAIAWLLMLCAAPLAGAEPHAEASMEDGAPDSHEVADEQPPIGVYGELVHAKGDVMVSYRYERIDMEGLMDGTDRLTLADVYYEYVVLPAPNGYAVIPQSLYANRHVFELMWMPLEEVTIVFGLPYIDKEMQQVEVATGLTYSTRAAGFGDLELALLYRVFQDAMSRVHLNVGISLPSGSTNVTDSSPANVDKLERLPYIMQLGSGTVDLRPGCTYTGHRSGFVWGAQVLGVLHAGTNDEGYKQGNSYHVTGWAGRRWVPAFETGVRLDWRQWFDPTGQDVWLQISRDPAYGVLSPAANSPAADPNLQAGRRLDLLFNVDYYVQDGALRGTRFGLEAGLPVYQDLDGPQLRTSWLLTAGAQYAF